MSEDSNRLFELAIAVVDGTEPSTFGFPLQPGVHLRWSFSRYLPYPRSGFLIERRLPWLHEFGTGTWEPVATVNLPTADLLEPERRPRGVAEARSRIEQRLLGAFEGRYDEMDFQGLVDLVLPNWPQTNDEIEVASESSRGPKVSTRKLDVLQLTTLDPRAALALGLYYVDPLLSGVSADYRVTGLWGSEAWPWNTIPAAQARERERGHWKIADVHLDSDRRMTMDAARENLLIGGSPALPFRIELPLPVTRLRVGMISSFPDEWFATCRDDSGRRISDVRVERTGSTLNIEAAREPFQQIELGQATSRATNWILNSLSFQITTTLIGDLKREQSVGDFRVTPTTLQITARLSHDADGTRAIGPEPKAAAAVVGLHISATGEHPTSLHVSRERVGSRIPEEELLTSTEVAPGPVAAIVTRARLDGADAGITPSGAAAYSVDATRSRATLKLTGGFVELRDSRLLGLGRDLAVELWVRPWLSSGTILAHIGRRRFSLAVNADAARLVAEVDGLSFESRAVLRDQIWTHVALSVSGRSVRLYVDGRLDTTASVREPTGEPSDRLILGAETSGAIAGRFSGHLADLILVGFALPPLRASSRNLAAAWPLDGRTAGAFDGPDLIAHGLPRFTMGHPETPSRRVLQLDGASWLSAPALRGLSELDSELTLEAWVRPDPGQDRPTIFGNDRSRSVWFGLVPRSYRLRFRINGSTYDSRTGITAGTWSHVAASTDGQAVRLWIDGRLDAVHRALIGAISPSRDSEFSIGADKGDYRFQGAIADARVWRRAPAPPTPMLLTERPLIAEWKLAGDARDTAGDNATTMIGTAFFERGHPLASERSVLVVNGSNFIVVEQPFSLIELANQITLDAWVRPTDLSGSPTIIGRDRMRGFWLGFTPEGHANFWINGGSFVSRGRVSPGVWTRVTVTYDGEAVSFYLHDALPDSTFPAPLGALTREEGPVCIGADPASSPGHLAYPFRGALADVRILSRALDPAACDRCAAIPQAQVAMLDRSVPIGRFRWSAIPGDGFGRLGTPARSGNVTVTDTDSPPAPSGVRAHFRPLAGTITSIIAPPEIAPTMTLVTGFVLPVDAGVRDHILAGLTRYDAIIEGAVAGRRREERILINNARATADGKLALDVQLPPLARLRPEADQSIRIEYDARLEVRWAWTGLQRVIAPEVATFQVYDRPGAGDTVEARIREVVPDSADPELFRVGAELATTPRRIEPSEWTGRYCLAASHRYRIETASRRGTSIEFSLRYLARPVVPPEADARIVFAVPLGARERDDPMHWEGRRTIVSAAGRLPKPERFNELTLSTISEDVYAEVRAQFGGETPARERLLRAELPLGVAAPRADEPEGALLGFSMDEGDWGWRTFRVFGARRREDRVTLYLLQPAGRAEAGDVVLRRAQHLRGAWLTETLDVAIDIPPDRGTQPCEVAVSAADRAPTPDPRGGPEARGNESALSSIARVIAVDRRHPPRLPAPRLSFDAADFFGDSRATVDWGHMPPIPHASFEVHRATDCDVFARDLDQRRKRQGSYSPELLPEATAVFDDDSDFEDWLAARFPEWAARSRADLFVPKPERDADATTWNAVTEVWRAWAERFYPALSGRDVVALAELPGNEAAFASVTPAPVSGPTHIDLIRGLADNFFLYRLRTRSPSFSGSDGLGLVSAPMRTPRVNPPGTPVFTNIESGDRSIRLDWALSREPSLASYRLYRARNAADIEDLRWFRAETDPRLIATIEDPLIRARGGEIVTPVLPDGINVASVVGVYRLDEFDTSRLPAEQAAFSYLMASATHSGGIIRGLKRIADGVPVAVVILATDGSVTAFTRRSQIPAYRDTNVLALRDYFYRLQAMDRFGNASPGSNTVVARAADLAPAAPPAWIRAAWVTPAGETPFVRLEWAVASEGSRCILQRRSERESTWRAVSDWIEIPDSTTEGTQFSAVDHAANPAHSYQYRVRVVNASGNPNAEHNVVDVSKMEA